MSFIGRVLAVHNSTGIDQVVAFVLIGRVLAVHNSTGTDQVVVFILYRACFGCAQQHSTQSRVFLLHVACNRTN